MELLGIGRQAEVFALSDSECVKLFYPGEPESAVRREAEHMRFVCEQGVPSPRFLGLTTIDGRCGIRMERLHGLTLLHDALENFNPSVDYGGLLGDIQRQYHQVRAEGLDDMADVLAWQIRQGDALPAAAREELVARLQRMPRGDRLVHMDYHSDNVVMTATGPRVIDWAGALRGDPHADAARTLLTLELKSYPADADHNPAMRQWLDSTRALCRAGYLRAYGAPVEKLNAWKPFIAAARLHCCPEEERKQNLQLIRESM